MVSKISDEKIAIKAVYNGEISAGSLLVSESRLVADLLLDKIDDFDWDRAILADKILQKRNGGLRQTPSPLYPKKVGHLATGVVAHRDG